MRQYRRIEWAGTEQRNADCPVDDISKGKIRCKGHPRAVVDASLLESLKIHLDKILDHILNVDGPQLLMKHQGNRCFGNV